MKKPLRLRLALVSGVLLMTCGVFFVARSARPRKTGLEALTPREICTRVNESHQIKIETAKGRYLKRVRLPKQNEESIRAQLDFVRRLPNTTVETLAVYEKHLRREYDTCVESAYYSGGRMRVEESELLSNDKSLPQLKAEILRTGVAGRNIFVSDGKVTKQLTSNESQRNVGHNTLDSFTVNKGGNSYPEFTFFGQVVVFRNPILGLIDEVVEPITISDGEAIVLRYTSEGGSKSHEYVFLPHKGFVAAKVLQKSGDVVIDKEEYEDFVQTNSGRWLPLHALKEGFWFNQTTSQPDFSSPRRYEYLALEPPQTNIDLDPNLFILRPPQNSHVVDFRKKNKDGSVPSVLASEYVEDNSADTEEDSKTAEARKAMPWWSGITQWFALGISGVLLICSIALLLTRALKRNQKSSSQIDAL